MKPLFILLAAIAPAVAVLRAAEATKPIENPKPKLKFTPTPKAEDGGPAAAGAPSSPVLPQASADAQIRELRRRMNEQMRALTGNDPAFADLDRMFDAMNGTGSGTHDIFAQAEARMREAMKQMETLRAAAGSGTNATDSGWKTITKTLPGGGTVTIRTRTETFGGTTTTAPKTPDHATKPTEKPDEDTVTPNADNTVVLPTPAPKTKRADA